MVQNIEKGKHKREGYFYHYKLSLEEHQKLDLSKLQQEMSMSQTIRTHRNRTMMSLKNQIDSKTKRKKGMSIDVPKIMPTSVQKLSQMLENSIELRNKHQVLTKMLEKQSPRSTNLTEAQTNMNTTKMSMKDKDSKTQLGELFESKTRSFNIGDPFNTFQ